MKIFEFAEDQAVKMSPFTNNMAILVKKAQAMVDQNLIKTVQVPVSKILFTQSLDNDAENHSVEDFNEYDSLPFAVKMDGFYHLLDGHHRIKKAMDEGNTRVLIFVADADADDIEIDESKKKKHQSTHSPVVPFVGRWWYGGFVGQDTDDTNDTVTSDVGDMGGGDGGE